MTTFLDLYGKKLQSKPISNARDGAFPSSVKIVRYNKKVSESGV